MVEAKLDWTGLGLERSGGGGGLTDMSAIARASRVVWGE